MRLKFIFSSLLTLFLLVMLPFSAMAEYNSMLAPTNFTPSTYIPPQYDVFDADYDLPVQLPDEKPDTPPIAEFAVYNGYALPNYSGTTETQFTFNANVSSDNETDGSRLEVRWDFENDGVPDSYFSVIKSIRHTFKIPGIYNVKLEVLDRGGNISSIIKPVTIVNNTPPFTVFTYTPPAGTEKTIYRFDASSSLDDQYLSSYLSYRFDWDGDGKWDTSFQQKNLWYHRFLQAGTFHVIMEAKDPGDQRSQTFMDIIVNANTPPEASFIVTKIAGNSGKYTYEFNASASRDNGTPHNRLWYRWDFNYHGADDIVYDTLPGYSDRHVGFYKLPGHKIIRLEVKDEDGATAYAYAEIDVEG